MLQFVIMADGKQFPCEHKDVYVSCVCRKTFKLRSTLDKSRVPHHVNLILSQDWVLLCEL